MVGVKYNFINYTWEAKIGQRVLGEFKTKEEAMECYDKKAKTVFNFPILNNKDEANNEPEKENS